MKVERASASHTVVPALNGHFCIQASVPTWQVSPHRRDRHAGVEGSVLPIYGRHMCR